MSKRTFIWFGLLIVVLAVVIPWRSSAPRATATTGDLKVPPT